METPVRQVKEDLRETRDFYKREYQGIVGDGKWENLSGSALRHIRSEKDRYKDVGRR